MPLAAVKNRAKGNDSRRARATRTLRNVILAMVVIGLLIGGMFVVYLWLNKPKVVTTAGPAAVSQSSPRQIKTTKPPANVPIGSSIQSISSPIAPGSNASLTLRTTESAVCSIKVVYIDKTMHEIDRVSDSGLGDKTADDFGMVVWTWTMPAHAAIATWQADMTCVRGDKSTRSVGEIVVQKPKQ